MKYVLLFFTLASLCACQGPKGDPGAPGSAGVQGSVGNAGASGSQGLQGLMGLRGPTGIDADVPFTYQGTIVFPNTTITQNIPGLSLESGDILNVYLRWHSGTLAWSQIGSTWVGGMAGSYAVNGTTLTIQVVTSLDTDWVIDGIHKQ